MTCGERPRTSLSPCVIPAKAGTQKPGGKLRLAAEAQATRLPHSTHTEQVEGHLGPGPFPHALIADAGPGRRGERGNVSAPRAGRHPPPYGVYRVNAVVVARAFQSVTTQTIAGLPAATAFFARSSAGRISSGFSTYSP